MILNSLSAKPTLLLIHPRPLNKRGSFKGLCFCGLRERHATNTQTPAEPHRTRYRWDRFTKKHSSVIMCVLNLCDFVAWNTGVILWYFYGDFLVILEIYRLHGRAKVKQVWNNMNFTVFFLGVNDPFYSKGTLHLQNIITTAQKTGKLHFLLFRKSL